MKYFYSPCGEYRECAGWLLGLQGVKNSGNADGGSDAVC